MDEDIVAALNAFSGWARETGIIILTATPDEVTCALGEPPAKEPKA